MSLLDTAVTLVAEESNDPQPETTADAVSTSALVVEVSQLRYALRARTPRSAAAQHDDLRAVLKRRDDLLEELRRRGLDFPDDRIAATAPRRADAPVTPGQDLTSDQDVALVPVDLKAKVEQLEQGMANRTVIGQAQGILIERHKVTADAAFALLVNVSNVTNRKLHSIAEELVLTGLLPDRR